MPFPSSQRSRPGAPQPKSPGTMTNAEPFSPGTKKQEGTILQSGGNEPSSTEWETGTGKPQE